MAWVETRITRTTQPQDACGLDFSHHLARIVNFAWSPRTGAYMAGGNSVGVASTGSAVAKKGGTRGALENHGQNGLQFSSTRAIVNKGFTCLYVGGHSSASFGILCDMPGGRLGKWGGDYALITQAGRRSFSNLTIPANAVVLASMNTSRAGIFLVNGVSATNLDLTGGETAGNGPTTFQLFQGGLGDRSSATYWSADAGLVVCFEGVVSNAEAKSLSDNPWQLFEPEIQHTWVPSTAASVTLPSLVQPVSTTSAGAWVATGAPSLHEAINELVPSDTQYISVNSASTTELVLAESAHPGAANQTLAYRASSTQGSTLTVTLKQGVTTIMTRTHSLTGIDTLYAQTLTAPEIALITAGAISVTLTTS